jgi:hypothetical protein
MFFCHRYFKSSLSKIMKLIINLIGGIAGSVALNILHETVKQFDHKAPRVDLVGEEGLNKSLQAVGSRPLSGNALYAAALAGDVLSNAFYYSLIGTGNKNHLLLRGAVYGIAAGVGALTLTKPLGLSDAPVTRTDQTKVMTVGYYTFGGLVAALTIKLLMK